MADDSYTVQLILTANNQLSMTVKGVTSDLGGMDRQMKQTAQAGGTLENSFKRMQTAMELGIAGAMLQKVGDIASEMYELGDSARIVSLTFENLTGGSSQANTMLSMLRETTGGIITDMNLMQGASKYLSMGLGSTSEEVNRLIELAVKLGGAMGNDATKSVEDFSLLLANESLLRLDTFGISSGRVRVRMEELQAAGEALTRSDAFRMAVLEEGALSLNRLGDAATAAETPLARFQVRMENIWTQASQNFAEGVNASMGLIEGLTSAANRSSADVHAADQEVYARGIVIGESFLRGYATALTPDNVYDITNAALERLRNDPSFDLSSPEAIPELVPNAMMMTDEQWQQASMLLSFIQDQNLSLEAAATNNERNLAIEENRARLAERTRDLLRQVTTFIADSARQNTINEQVTALFDQADMAAQLLSSVANPTGRGAIDGITLITGEELANVEQLARQYEQALDAAKDMHDQDLISDEQLAYLTRGADEVERMRDAARDGAEALRNLSMAQVFGEGVGSTTLGTDLSSSFLDAARGLNMDAADYQNLADTIMLSTGEITQASLTYRDEVIPLLLQVAQQLGDDAAARGLANVEGYLRDAAMQGLTPEQTAAGMLGATGYTTIGGSAGGSAFTVEAGDTPTSVANRYGLTTEQVMRGAGITDARYLQPGTYGSGGGGGAVVPFEIFDNPAGLIGMTNDAVGSRPRSRRGGGQQGTQNLDTSMQDAQSALELMLPNAEAFSGLMDTVKGNTEKMATDLDAVNASLDEISSKTVTVKLNLDTSGVPSWFMQMIETGVRDNGGSVPGTTPRGRTTADAH